MNNWWSTNSWQQLPLFPEGDTPWERESYAIGFDAGLTWPKEWSTHGRPGGPWVGSGDRPGYKRELERNIAWLNGYDAGRGKRVTQCPHCGLELTLKTRNHFVSSTQVRCENIHHRERMLHESCVML